MELKCGTAVAYMATDVFALLRQIHSFDCACHAGVNDAVNQHTLVGGSSYSVSAARYVSPCCTMSKSANINALRLVCLNCNKLC